MNGLKLYLMKTTANYHISNTPMDLIKYCQDKGIVMEGYSPAAHGEALKNVEHIKDYGEHGFFPVFGGKM